MRGRVVWAVFLGPLSPVPLPSDSIPHLSPHQLALGLSLLLLLRTRTEAQEVRGMESLVGTVVGTVGTIASWYTELWQGRPGRRERCSLGLGCDASECSEGASWATGTSSVSFHRWV